MKVLIVSLLIWNLELTKHVSTKFFKLLLEVVWSDDVNDEADLLLSVFVALSLLNDLLAFLLKLSAEIIGFLSLELIFLGQRLSISVWLTDSLLETILALAILVVLPVAAASAPVVISGLLSAALVEPGALLKLSYF